MPKIICSCEQCGKQKELFPSDAKRFRFCSRKCQGLHLRQTNNVVSIGKKNETYYGYIEMKTDEGWMLEHRYIMEKELGRKLSQNEEIHHVDGNRKNNDLSNLKLMDKKDHFQEHQENLIEKWKEAEPWKHRERDSTGRFL